VNIQSHAAYSVSVFLTFNNESNFAQLFRKRFKDVSVMNVSGRLGI